MAAHRDAALVRLPSPVLFGWARASGDVRIDRSRPEGGPVSPRRHDAIPVAARLSRPDDADRDAVGVIVLDGLTKRFGSHVAVDAVTASVRPGRVTGLLGPDGSGRTTILRCILGLTRPTSGSAIVLGRRYRQLARPLREVGALRWAGVTVAT